MNNSKKLQTKKEKKDRLVEQKPITKISLPWIIVAAVLLVVLIGGLLFDQLYEPTLLTVDGKKYQMSDLSYYVYNVESKYQYYDQMFGGNGAYWDMTYDETTGETVRDVAKDEAIQAALYNNVLYNQAVSEGYSLTEDEKNTISTNVDSLLKEQIPAAVVKKNHYTKSYLTKIMSQATLAERYRQDKVTALNIDKDAIKAGIKFEDYRQYDIQYLFISTKTTDADGNSVDMNAIDKKMALDKISSVYDKAKTTEDWSTLVPADETQLTYKDTSFITTDTTYSDALKTKMMGMENGAVSELYEDPDTGYYIIRMVNNNSSESYDTAVQNAITQAEDEGFQKVYENDILPKHTTKINDKALEGYTMGTLTLAD